MKKLILSAMMMMAVMCFNSNVNAQDNGDKKPKKECCEKKHDKGNCEKHDKGSCEKHDKGSCEKKCDKHEAKTKDCKKCTECKAECGDNGCKACPNNHKCEKNCKK